MAECTGEAREVEGMTSIDELNKSTYQHFRRSLLRYEYCFIGVSNALMLCFDGALVFSGKQVSLCTIMWEYWYCFTRPLITV